MSAAEKSHNTVSMSELDKEDGLKVNGKADSYTITEDMNFGQYLQKTLEKSFYTMGQQAGVKYEPVSGWQNVEYQTGAADGTDKTLNAYASDPTTFVVVGASVAASDASNSVYHVQPGNFVDGQAYSVYQIVNYEYVPEHWLISDMMDALVIEGKNSVVTDVKKADWNITFRTGNREYTSVDSLQEAIGFDFEVGTDYDVVIGLTWDYLYADGSATNCAGSDEVDDRTQQIFEVYLETAPNSGYYKAQVHTYVLDAGDDFVKLFNAEELNNVPGMNEVAGKENEYMYVYTVKGDKIYANWEKVEENSVKDETPAGNTLDKDGDGIVTCDEYYGVTGLKWDDKKNACVTTSVQLDKL